MNYNKSLITTLAIALLIAGLVRVTYQRGEEQIPNNEHLHLEVTNATTSYPYGIHPYPMLDSNEFKAGQRYYEGKIYNWAKYCKYENPNSFLGFIQDESISIPCSAVIYK